MKRLREIEERLSAIKKEANNEGTDIEALTIETEGLLEERSGLLNQIEKRRSMLEKISGGIAGEGTPIMGEEEVRSYGRDSAEYRSAFLKNIRGIELNEKEKRAFSSTTGSAGVAIPTQTANEIIKKMKQLAPLLEEITLLHVAGNVTFAIEDTVQGAEKHTENASISGAADKLTSVTLGSFEITKLVQVSKTVATMSIGAFEVWLTDMLAGKITEKIGTYLISGTGSSQPAGVEKAATWGDTNSVTVTLSGVLTDANVQTMIGLLNGAYDKNAKFLMNKRTLFTDFMPLQNNSKNKIVTTEGHDYYVYGYPVMLDDNVAPHEAYLGDFKKIIGNLSETINVVSGFDINTNSYKYLGCAMFDSKVADANAFVKLIKATS